MISRRRAWVGSTLLLVACPASPNSQRVIFSPSIDGRHGQPDAPASTPPLADPESVPALTRDEIRLVVRAKLPEVRACYEAGLGSDPELAGTVTLHFTIDAGGRVREPTIVEDELAPSSVSACLLEQIVVWQFPLPRAASELVINYPFHFTNEDTLRAAGLPRVQGTLRAEAIGAVFDAHRDELDECMRAAGIASGTIDLAFEINDAGAVSIIGSYRSSLPHEADRCILRTISSWSFPAAAPGDVALVNHDLVW